MRIRIVGVSGAWKSQLAEKVADRTGLTRLDQYAVFWDAGWTFRDLDSARAIVRDFTAEHPGGWVADGNWTNRLDRLLEPGTPDGADVVVWLDHPRSLVMPRVIGRTLWRGITRAELWHGNRETPSSWLKWDPDENIMRWAWTQHSTVRERMIRRIDNGESIVRLRGQRAVNRWLESLPARCR